MKKPILTGLLSIISLVCYASNPDFIKFALEQAHSKGFTGCDYSIKSAFENAGGDDIRVNVDWFNDTKKDSLKLTSTYGVKGDSIYLEAALRKYAGKCFITQTTILTSPKSCIAYANGLKEFKFVAESTDYTCMKNNWGIPMILKSLNGGCVAVFQKSSNFEQTQD